ncbi:septation protein SepH [Salinactinospora qingdaonensis]|uniref:DUF3071 domain-containing protein n=1 Tax=Salinactinospora qingdaonensis TaxID=702744 RepID=A0ABP7EYP3_9ACTN
MQELRLVAVSEDGTYLVLASAGRGTRFTLPVDDRLRAAVRGQFSRLGQYEIEVENPLRPKEIQARIRSGETAEAISEAAGIPIERVRWFEGPVLQEREYMAQQAQRAAVRRQGETSPGPMLGDIVGERIGAHQLETGDATWDSWKREDATWQVKLTFLAEREERVAHWIYDPRRRCVTPHDDEAVRFSSPEAAEPLELGPDSANVTPFVPRRPATREAPPESAQQTPAAPEAPAAPSEPQHAPPQEPAPPATPPAATPGGRMPITAERSRPSEPQQERQPSEPAAAADASASEAPPQSQPQEQRPVASPPAATRSSPAAGRAAEGTPPLSAAAAAGGTQPANQPAQPSRRKGRGRRASVPSWDEIMFGAKKPE